MEIKPYTVEFTTGFNGGDGQVKSITFGKAVTGLMLFEVDAVISQLAEGNLHTRRELYVIQRSITAVGERSGTASVFDLESMDEFDIADLMDGFDKFNEQLTKGRNPEFISDSEVTLSIGFERAGYVYTKVKFGSVVTGRDMTQADGNNFQGLKRTCFLIGRQIVSLTTEDGANEIKGPIDIELFGGLHQTDIFVLRVASERWRDSFRTSRRKVQRQEVGAERVDNSEGNGMERVSNT